MNIEIQTTTNPQESEPPIEVPVRIKTALAERAALAEAEAEVRKAETTEIAHSINDTRPKGMPPTLPLEYDTDQT